MPKRLLDLFRKSPKPSLSEPIIIVSGLPRSGTSMMMKMLEAGGLKIVTDNIRTADEDNPKGYFELERVKKLKEGDQDWLQDSQGKVIKVISALLEHLPAKYTYKVIFMRRSMDEILASQKQMLIRRDEPTDKISDEEMAVLFEKHLAKVENWLEEQPNMDVTYINFNEVIKDPTNGVAQVSRLLGGNLDTLAMENVIDTNLYRQRR